MAHAWSWGSRSSEHHRGQILGTTSASRWEIRIQCIQNLGGYTVYLVYLNSKSRVHTYLTKPSDAGLPPRSARALPLCHAERRCVHPFTANVAVGLKGQALGAGVRVGAAPSAAPRLVALGVPVAPPGLLGPPACLA